MDTPSHPDAPVAAAQAVQTLRLHMKILFDPTSFSPQKMVDAMREVYEPAGIAVEVASTERLDLPLLLDVEVKNCTSGSMTDDQTELFSKRENAGSNDLCIYLVRSTDPPTNGCAAHPPGQPGAIVVHDATLWTLAHEVGHALGLDHVTNDRDRLMTQATVDISNPPPDLVPSEVATILASPLTQ
jgi:hypothetical protein